MTDWQSLHGRAFAGQRILVTGGAGFLGSHIVEALVCLGSDVVALDDLSGGSWDNVTGFGDKVRKITASILDPEAVAIAMAGCRYVFHEAALASVPQSVAEPERFYRVNVLGTLNVMQAARACGVERVIYAGSSSAYGDPADQGPKHENLPALPVSPYASSKLAGEELLRAWSHSYGIDTAILRYFNIFGPRQNANSAYAAAIAAFAKALATGNQPLIFGDGEQTRDFVFVRNIVHANLLAARCLRKLHGEVFNIATGKTVTVNQLYNDIARIMGKSHIKAEYRPSRAGDVRHSSADISKAQSTLSYEPVFDFAAGLEETISWYERAFATESSEPVQA